MASNDPERKEEEETGEIAAGEDEDTGAQIAPIVRLEEVSVTTGEEDEDILLDLKAKLYRFDRDGNQWKERGTGSVKILKHKETGKARLVMRQVKTLKICANHLILPSIKLQEHAGNDKSCVWHATDYSDGELKDETFCIRFGSVDNCRLFMDTVENQAQALGRADEEDSQDVTDAAGELEKLSVDKNEGEEKAKDEGEEKTKDEASTTVDDEASTKDDKQSSSAETEAALSKASHDARD